MSATLIPSKLAAKNSSLDAYSNANSANWFASSTNVSFLPTKSVSQPKTIEAPTVLSAFTFEIAAPSVDSLSALLAATFCLFS